MIGAAEAECLYAEANWKGRDDYALRSMAQTRATSKALRQPLGFVISLAGFDPTPAEEMPSSSGFKAPEHVIDYLSDAQRKKLYALRTKLSKAGVFDADTFYKALESEYQVDAIEKLERKDASALIERLEKVERDTTG